MDFNWHDLKCRKEVSNEACIFSIDGEAMIINLNFSAYLAFLNQSYLVIFADYFSSACHSGWLRILRYWNLTVKNLSSTILTIFDVHRAYIVKLDIFARAVCIKRKCQKKINRKKNPLVFQS